MPFKLVRYLRHPGKHTTHPTHAVQVARQPRRYATHGTHSSTIPTPSMLAQVSRHFV